jgi:hypothetical protein
MLLLALFACETAVEGPHALAYDGPPDCGIVEVGAAPESFTVEVWMRGDPTAAAQLRPFANWEGIFELSERDDGIVIFGVGEERDVASYAFSQMDGVLHHLAGTYDAADGAVRLFVDGVLAGANTAYLGDAASSLHFGCSASGTSAFYGILDEFRVSKVVRYTADFDLPTAAFSNDNDTEMLFHFDEGTGTTATSDDGAYTMELSDTSWVEFALGDESGEGG